MPFINTKVSVSLSDEKVLSLKAKFGKAIELLPGKTEEWLMLNFEDNCKLFFKGSCEKPLAFVEVMLLGKASPADYDKMTAGVTKIISDELSIAPSQIYVKYEECDYWGWNGKNF